MSNVRPSDEILEEPFWLGLAQGRLDIQRCDKCHQFQHPPKAICTHCRSFDLSFASVSGHGVLHSYTIAYHAVHPVMADKVPYAVGYVMLAEGPGIVARLDVPFDKLICEMRLSCRVDRLSTGFALPFFTQI